MIFHDRNQESAEQEFLGELIKQSNTLYDKLYHSGPVHNNHPVISV
jgi:hypothetical protein